MTIKDNQCQNEYKKHDFSNEKSYNDIPCQEGELLAPMVVRDNAMVKSFQMNPDNFKTWRFMGHPVRVAFIPVAQDQFETTMRIFNQDVKEYLSRHTKSNLETISLEKCLEDMDAEGGSGVDPTRTESEVETLMLFETLEELIEEVYRKDQRKELILKAIYEDMDISKQDIIKRLGLAKTRGYELIKEAHELARETYLELNR